MLHLHTYLISKIFHWIILLITKSNLVCLKSSRLKLYLTKTEMNTEWNVNFLQNTRCGQKVSRQKWTMNETSIFFEIQDVFKKYSDWNSNYPHRNEQWLKRPFSLKYKMCSKSIQTEILIIHAEMNNEWNVNFLQNTRYVQ